MGTWFLQVAQHQLVSQIFVFAFGVRMTHRTLLTQQWVCLAMENMMVQITDISIQD